ncbi:CDGSH iron-sulfur domain-containing protein [Sulfurihydrogenibium subterraneum]|uniref:CDGSH iron-sulfur domain-containing protein n=1 Tax=Sulfurihydrogenibium subterraneum TaxID=171121 RepID=UPI00048F3F67|nr:CDGSH iron-sulfur domain-containing protein [Sulfurihydrogenibium subterraneum]
MKIKVLKNGPYLVEGNIPLYREEMISYKMIIPQSWKKMEKFETKETYALCRCGLSKNKPFCNGSHKQGFDGEETADIEIKDEHIKTFEGQDLDLLDIKYLCASARFCLKGKGIWDIIKEPNNKEKYEDILQIVSNCPSGRLVLKDKNGNYIEPNLEKEITILEDNLKGVSSAIWVKGGIPIESSKGYIYQIRNRITLCRCGNSKNKPFCDGTHLKVKFKDESYYKGE